MLVSIKVDPHCESCPIVMSCIDQLEDLDLVRETAIAANKVYEERLAEDDTITDENITDIRIAALSQHVTSLSITDREIDLHVFLANKIQADCRQRRERQSTKLGRFSLTLRSAFSFRTPSVPGCNAPHASEIKGKVDRSLATLSHMRHERTKQGWV